MTQPAAYQQEERRAAKLKQVRGLLAKADSTKFPAEADSFRAKADELMAAYALSEFDVRLNKEFTRPEPISRPLNIQWWLDSPRNGELFSLLASTAAHCRVFLVPWKPSTNARTGEFEMPAVGMPADLDYLDMLFTHLWAQMSKGLEPHPDTDKPMIENLVAMKEAGMKWERIGELLHGVGQLGEPYTRNQGVKFTKLYTDYCDQHDRPRLRTSPQVYQRSFAQGFVRGVRKQFRIQRELSEPAPADRSLEQVLTGQPGSTAIALRDIAQLAEDKAHELFGYPGKSRSRGGKRNVRAFDGSAFDAGRVAGVQANTKGASARDAVGAGRKELGR